MASPFVHRFISAGQYFLYDVNTNGVFEVDKILYDLIEDVEWVPISSGDTATSKLILKQGYGDPGINSSSTADETCAALQTIEEYHTLYGAFSSNRPRSIQFPILRDQLSAVYPALGRHLILGITEQCNLRCSYCAYSGTYKYNRVHGNATMTEETALQAIDFFIAHSTYILASTDHPLYIGFYGGEPLLNHHLVRTCIEHLNTVYPEIQARVKLNLATNLTVADPAILRFLVDNEVQIQVSLDGPPPIHDRYRKTQSGVGTAAQVRRNLTWLRDNAPDFYKTHVSFSITVAPPYDLPQVVDFFENDDLVKGHPTSIRFVVDVDTTFLSTFGPEQSELVGTQLRELRRRFVAQVCSGELVQGGLLYSMFGQLLRDFVFRPSVRLTDTLYPGGICLPGCQRTFVDVSGKLHICEKIDDRLPIGDVRRGFDYDRIGTLINQYEQLGKEACTECWACRFCTNCFYTAQHEDELDRNRMLQTCASRKNDMDQVLEDYAEISIKASCDAWSIFQGKSEDSAADCALRYLRDLRSIPEIARLHL